MSLLRLLLNVLWILTGGLWMAVGWLIAALLMIITIVGLPWARAAFSIASYTLLPFGRVAVRREEREGQQDLGTGPLGTIGNVRLAHARRVVAGARAPDYRDRSRHYDYRHSLRLGAPQAGCAFAVAGWQDHRDHRGGGEPSTQDGARLGRVWRPKSGG